MSLVPENIECPPRAAGLSGMTRTLALTRNIVMGAFLVSALLGAAAAVAAAETAGDFPDLPIPPSDGVLTGQEVKNIWISAVKDLPIPRKPNGLHLRAQERCRANLQKRQAFINAVRAGTHDTRAELARLELLEVQRQAALAQIEASRTLAAIQAEFDALRSSCSHACCAH